MALAADGPADRLQTMPTEHGIELTWADAEDRIQGMIMPNPPREGQELRVSVHVGSFEGKPFDGPVTFSLRRDGETHGEIVTVPRSDVTWVASFRPNADGRHRLDVSFRTTRLKVVHADVQVAPAPIPRAVSISVVAAVSAAALAFGIRAALKSRNAG